MGRTDFYSSTHWRSEILSGEEIIQWNFSCATILTLHKQLFAKNFAVVELDLGEDETHEVKDACSED